MFKVFGKLEGATDYLYIAGRVDREICNHRNPIATLEYFTPGGHGVPVPRTSHNYFLQTNPGMGPGPYALWVG